MVGDKKRDIWKSKVIEAKGTSNMWSMLKNLTNPKNNDPSRVIIKGDRTLVSNKQKADGFVRAYHTASTLKIEKHNRSMRENLNDYLRRKQNKDEGCQAFSDAEVKAAVRQLNPAEAAGLYRIHSRLMHHMGPKAIEVLTDIYNTSWLNKEVPQERRVANIS